VRFTDINLFGVYVAPDLNHDDRSLAHYHRTASGSLAAGACCGTSGIPLCFVFAVYIIVLSSFILTITK